jgi:hypothetical protein
MISKVAGVADCMIMTNVVADEMISMDGMARKSMPAKSVSGEAMGSKATEAVEAAPAKSMKPTASAKSMEPTASAKSMEPTASAKSMPTTSPATPSACKRRDVRHDAKRAYRNARRQNAYCSFAHSAIPIRSLDRWYGGACITAQTSPHLTFDY